MLKLKPQYFGHLMWTANSLEKPLMLGKIEGSRGRDGWMHHWVHGHEFEKTVKDREVWLFAVHEVAKSQTWLNDWTTTTTLKHRWPWNSSPCCHLKSFAQLSVFHLRPSRSQCSRHYGLPSLPKAKTPLDDKAVAYLVPSARSTFPSSGFLPN